MNDHPRFHTLPAAGPEEAGLSAAGLSMLSAVMQREVETRHVPGVSMMIARGGKVGYRRDFGALRPGGPALRGDAIFRIYSMTKPIVSIALMMLVEEGKLFIADPIGKFVPELANVKVGVENNGTLELVAAKRYSAVMAKRSCLPAIPPTPKIS
jgi:CubicO group peptidase (beta-lactamase class C family)